MEALPFLPRFLRPIHRKFQAIGFYPSSLQSAVTFVVIYVALELAGRLEIPTLVGLNANYTTTSEHSTWKNVLTTGLLFWALFGTLRKWILRRLLCYQEWLCELKKPSIMTKLFAFTLRLLNGWKSPLSRQLFGLQGILPSLPVPALDATVNQYLQSLKPLLDPKQMEEAQYDANKFLTGPGPKLQLYLQIKSWFYPNYVSDWWEKYCYLADRSPLLLGTNPYAIDCLNPATKDQAARAALMTWAALDFRQKILDNQLKPILINGTIPLCNWQYERAYNTARIPGEDIDSIHHEISYPYLAVYAKGKYWRVNVFRDGRRKELLSPAEFQLQFQRILDDPGEAHKGEERLAALTTWDRRNWARARGLYLTHGVNRLSLDVIEKSAFLLCLDDEDYSMECSYETSSKEEEAPLDDFCRKTLCGNGYNRWVDKSVILAVGKNGGCGGMAEHSWSDGGIVGHMWETCLAFSIGFTDLDTNGKICTPVKVDPSYPERLHWDLPEECLSCIDRALNVTKEAISAVDLKVFGFKSFGKGLMKRCGVSADAFVQMALQLAYYRDQGHFDLTYESATARLFLQGRTETIRGCTEESCRWVLGMENTNLEASEKVRYFAEACAKHAEGVRKAMTGRACDRHLFALYVMSKYLKMDEPFLKEALARPWKLSTTQIPFSQIRHKTLQWVGIGFAPVCPEGYGVAYVFIQEDLLFFHVSSNKSFDKTDSKRFSKAIQQAMFDIKDLFFSKED